ncbi:MAG: AAA family ATPase [Verrucomicrobiae bacterium]|nr:AAA family ATPase [Verrucomicrobiae bacterium]
MIRSLSLKNYGKFPDRRFEFDQITVFCGPNEAGKTTIFDALRQALCSIDGRRDRKKSSMLHERYGEDRSAEIETDGERPGLISIDEFDGFFAIRGGDVRYDISDDAGWMQKVKSRLFSGGIDHARLIKILNDLAGDNLTLRHNREIKELEEELRVLTERLNKDKNERRDILGREQALHDLKKEIDLRREELSKAQIKSEELKMRCAAQDEARQRRRLEEASLLIAEAEKMEKEIEESVDFADEQSLVEFDCCKEDEDRLAGQVARMEGQREELLEKAEKIDAEKRDACRQAAEARQVVGTAGRILGDMALFMERSSRPEGIRRDMGLLIAGATMIILGATLAVALPGMMSKGVAAVACAALGVACFVFSRKDKRTFRSNGEADDVARFRDDWINSVPGAAPVVETMGGLQEFILGRKIEAQKAAGLPAAIEEREREDRARIKDLETEIRRARESCIKAKEKKESWLVRHKVKSRDDFVRQAAVRRQLIEQRKSNAEKTGRLCVEMQVSGIRQLQFEVRRRLADFDQRDVARAPMPEPDVRKLRHDAGAAEDHVKTIQSAINQLQLKHEGDRKLMIGSLGGIPGRILDDERRMAGINRELERRRLDKRAAALAATLFGGVEENAGKALKDLGRTMAVELEIALGHGRKVEIGRLAEKDVRVEDASGKERKLDLLSGGTRDCFVLAARIALAKKAGWENGVLVFDEPFHSLDDDRRRGVLTMLARCRSETHWQMVFFTKDQELAGAIKAAFSGIGVKLNPLDPTARG